MELKVFFNVDFVSMYMQWRGAVFQPSWQWSDDRVDVLCARWIEVDRCMAGNHPCLA